MSSDLLQGFFESLTGQIITVVVIILLFTGILISGKGKKLDTNAMVSSAILVALAIALNQIVLFRMPQGGSVTAFSMLPIVICAIFYGLRRGLMAGMCVGLIDLIFNPYVIHPVQMILDYPLAFGALAFSSLLFTKNLALSLHIFLALPADIFVLFCLALFSLASMRQKGSMLSPGLSGITSLI